MKSYATALRICKEIGNTLYYHVWSFKHLVLFAITTVSLVFEYINYRHVYKTFLRCDLSVFLHVRYDLGKKLGAS